VSKENANPSEGLEYRHNTVRTLIEKFLKAHKGISSMDEISRGVLALHRKNGTRLRVFVTHTYFFTEYTYEKALAEDPNISAVLCSNPYGDYSKAAKKRTLEDGIGLFTLAEFMGALNFEGDRFLNFLLGADREARINLVKEELSKCNLKGCQVFLFGSYLRKNIFNDIDLLLVYPRTLSPGEVDVLIGSLKAGLSKHEEKLHIEPCSINEFATITRS